MLERRHYKTLHRNPLAVSNTDEFLRYEAMKINYYQIEAEKEKFHTALLGLFLYWEV
jgi:hypothetical protein